MEASLFFVILAVLGPWATFWIIRLGVRYGTNDALRMNRDWLEARGVDRREDHRP